MSKTPRRTIRLEQAPDSRGVGVFSISEKSKQHWYAYREIPSEIGGRGFIVHKLGFAPAYCVLVGEPRECTCECLGFYAHNRCKHIDGLTALIRAKVL